DKVLTSLKRRLGRCERGVWAGLRGGALGRAGWCWWGAGLPNKTRPGGVVLVPSGGIRKRRSSPPHLRNDGEPTPRVVFEGVALKWIELVADEDRDGHGSLRDRQPYPAAFRGEHASDIVELCLLDERRRRARCRPRRRRDRG